MNFESFFEKFPKFLNIDREAISKWHPLGSLDRFKPNFASDNPKDDSSSPTEE